MAPDGQPDQGHHGAPARHDPGARDRRCQMDQRGRDDQREEAEDVEPRVSRLQEGPPLDDGRNAGEHGDDEADPKGDLREGRTVRGHDQRSTRSAAGAQRPESRDRRAGETGQVAERTRDGQGHDPARNAEARGRRPTRDQPDRATANDRVDRRSDGEGRDEERQDAGDGRAGGPGKREVERQPHAPPNRFGQGCRRHSQGQEAGADQETGQRDPTVGHSCDRPSLIRFEHDELGSSRNVRRLLRPRSAARPSRE